MEFYIIYWCHNIDSIAHNTLVGVKYDSNIKEVNYLCKGIVTKTKKCEGFIIRKYVILDDFKPDYAPYHENDYFDIVESRYSEVHPDGTVRVYHKRRYCYV